MIDTDTRATGVKLRILDLTPVYEAAARSQVTSDPDGGVAPAYEVGFAPYAMAEHDGHLYVVCSEGVGWEVTDAEPLQVDLYAKRPGKIAIIPTLQATLSPEQVRELATGEEVDLADHVRRFGSRLESNFWGWHRRLGGRA